LYTRDLVAVTLGQLTIRPKVRLPAHCSSVASATEAGDVVSAGDDAEFGDPADGPFEGTVADTLTVAGEPLVVDVLAEVDADAIVGWTRKSEATARVSRLSGRKRLRTDFAGTKPRNDMVDLSP
jgi:hypothetical protein